MEGNNNSELIFSLLLDGRGGACNYTWKEIEAWSLEMGTLWIHLNLPEERGDNWIIERSGVPQIISEPC